MDGTRERNLATEFREMLLSALTAEHLACLKQAMSNICCTKLAFDTFTQAIDGMPTRDVWDEYRAGNPRFDIDSHLECSQEARQAMEAYRANHDVGALTVNDQVAQAYQDTLPGTWQHTLRLVEIVANICHDIAATLFENASGGLLQPDLDRSDVPDYMNDMYLMKIPPKPTLLYHADYMDYEDYPRGVPDIVGYWAEYRLFGGVVLFDRGPSGTECRDVYIHPIHGYMIYQLSATQIQELAGFLTTREPREAPLPMRAEKYALRVDPYQSMYLNIYRKKYERRVPSTPPRCCFRRGEDYDPDLREKYKELSRQNEIQREM